MAQRGISAAHYDMRFAKPIDEMMLHEVFGKFKHVITLEDGCIMGGFEVQCWSSWVTKGTKPKYVDWGCLTATSNTAPKENCTPRMGTMRHPL